jgi:AraC family transcriptional regulator
MHIEIEQLPAMRVGTVRHVGPYNEIGPAFQRVAALAGASGLFQTPGAVMLGIYHDDPRSTPPAQLRSDAAVALPAGVELPDGLAEQVTPSGRYARATHVGPYERLPDAWAEFGASLGASGHRLREGPGFEIYRNDMSQTPSEELRTDLYMPVE